MNNDPFEHLRRMQEMWKKVNSPFSQIQNNMAWVNQINSSLQRIHEQMNLIRHSVDSVHFGARQAMLNSLNPAYKQLQGLALSRSFLDAQGINQALRIDFSKISPAIELAQKQKIMLSQIVPSEAALRTIQRWDSLVSEISESKYLDDEVGGLEVTPTPTNSTVQATEEVLSPNNSANTGFTWRDLLQIVSILISLISLLDSGNSRDTSLAEEAYETGAYAVAEINETLDQIYDFFTSYFPTDPEDSGDDQELP